MNPSWIGIRASAVLAILGSAMTLFLAGTLAWAAFHVSEAESPAMSQPMLKGMMIALAVFFAAFGVWGITTAAGVLRRRPWSRLSMIIFAVLLVGMGGSAVVGMLFIHLPDTPNVAPAVMRYVRLGITTFYASLTVIGVWWLMLFNGRATKLYFSGERPAAQPASPARPLSITIIGWYLLLGAIGSAAGAVLRLPGMFFGLTFTGWTALAVYTAFAAAQIFLGTGLLQLQNSARMASIVYFGVAVANVIACVLLPGFPDRMRILMNAFPAWQRANYPLPEVAAMQGMMLCGTLFALVPIWFLVRRRPAFA